MGCSHLRLLLIGAVFGAFAREYVSAAPQPTVTIASGVVIGTQTTLPSATAAVNKFIGIPFAESPPKRFSPPKPPSSWTKPLVAVETKPACIQQFSYPKDERKKVIRIFDNPGGPRPPESENCLYVNVYAPPNTNSSYGKPVLFWIYGGNLQFGSGGLEYYDGSSFAYNQDVIVVTHNYRTNVFGFPNIPGTPTSEQNAGFLDQRAALAWTRDNIAKFGGDPDKITIFGESAGGYSVKQLVTYPPNPLPFRAAIIESYGAAFTGNSTLSWETLVSMLGCHRASSPVNCVRKKPTAKIKSIIEKNELDFAPVPNGQTSTLDIRPVIRSGKAAKVPIMIGTNKQEGRAFAYTLGFDNPGASLEKFLDEQFPGDTKLQKSILRVYSNANEAPYILISDVITDASFLCKTSLFASFVERHRYKVWRYLFSADFPNVNTFPRAGVYHTTEIPEVFGTYPLHNRYGNVTKQQIELSKYMQAAWANFAKNPSEGPGWPELGSAGNVGELGGDGSTGEKTIPASSLDRTCFLYNPLVRAAGL